MRWKQKFVSDAIYDSIQKMIRKIIAYIAEKVKKKRIPIGILKIKLYKK